MIAKQMIYLPMNIIINVMKYAQIIHTFIMKINIVMIIYQMDFIVMIPSLIH